MFQWIRNPTNQGRLSNHKVNAGCTVEVLHRSNGRRSTDFQYVNWLEILPSQICCCFSHFIRNIHNRLVHVSL